MSHARIEEMLTESGLHSDEMTEVADLLAPLADPTARPTPSPELEALFGTSGALPDGQVTPLFTTRRGAAAGALVLALAGVGATGLSAAANTLPRPLQHQVSEFSRHYLPFDLPEPPPKPEQELPLGAQLPRPADISRQDSETASRSMQARPEQEGIDGQGRDQLGPQPTPGPSAAPGPTASAEPSASPSPSPSGSPSPSYGAEGGWGVATATPTTHPDKSRPGDKGHDDDKRGDDGKGKGAGKDSGKGPGNGHGGDQGGQGQGQGAGQGPGQGHGQGHGSGDGPGGASDEGTGSGDGGSGGGGGGGGGQDTVPVPDDPTPTIPLPDPLPVIDVPGLGDVLGGD